MSFEASRARRLQVRRLTKTIGRTMRAAKKAKTQAYKMPYLKMILRRRARCLKLKMGLRICFDGRSQTG